MRVQHERLLVLSPGEDTFSIPSREIERLVMLGPAEVSAPAIRHLLWRRIPVVYCSTHGRYYGTLSSACSNTDVLLAQVGLYRDQEYRLGIARAIVASKIRHMRSYLHRISRRLGYPAAAAAADRTTHPLERLAQAVSIPQLMGLEGQASSLYFATFGQAFRRPDVRFSTRSRQPPRDPANALLSLGYTLVLGEAISAIMAEGLHPGIGFLHEIHRDRPSLALDILEIFRQPVVDRLTLSLFNLGTISPEDFVGGENAGKSLKPESLKRFLGFYERAMTESFTFEERRVDFRTLLANQVRSLRTSLLSRGLWQPVVIEM